MLVNLCRASDKLPAFVPVLAAWMVTRGHIHSNMLREAHTPAYLHLTSMHTLLYSYSLLQHSPFTVPLKLDVRSHEDNN